MSTEEQRRQWRETRQRNRDRARFVYTPPVARIFCAKRGRERGEAETFARVALDGSARCCYCRAPVRVAL